MKFRWKLKTLFVVILIAAMFLARYSYLQNRYTGLSEFGATVAYDWERPTILKNEYGTYAAGKETWIVRHTLNKSPLDRTWQTRLKTWIVDDQVIGVIVDRKAWDDSAIETLRSMPELEFVLIDEISTMGPHDPKLAGLIERLKDELPEVKIHIEAELKR